MKKRIVQDVKIGIFAVCLILSAIFAVLAFLPESGPVEVAAEFTASSVPINLTEGTYEVVVEGVLRNKTDRKVAVEKIEIYVNGFEKTPYAVNIELLPHEERAIGGKTILQREAGKVKNVTVTVNGKTQELRNPATGISFRRVWLPCFLTLLFAALTVHAAIVRFYLHEAERKTSDPDGADDHPADESAPQA